MERKCPECINQSPVLWLENQEAWELWQAVSDQWRMGGLGQPMGLDLTAVQIAAEILEVPLDWPMWRKIRVLERSEKGFAGSDSEKVKQYCDNCRKANKNNKCFECDLGAVQGERQHG